MANESTIPGVPFGQLPTGIFDKGGKFEPKQEFIDAARAKALEEGKKYFGDATGFEKFKDRLFDIPDATIALVSGTAETLSEFALGLAKETLKGAQLSTTADPEKIKEIRESPGFTSYFDQLNFPRSDIYETKISGTSPTDLAEFVGKYIAPVPGGIFAAGAKGVAVPAGRGITQLADDIIKSFTRGDSSFRASAGPSELFLKATKQNTPLNNALKEIGEERLSQMTVKEAAEFIGERYPNINKSNLKGNLYDKNIKFKSTDLKGDLKKNALSALDELGQDEFFKITADNKAFTKGKFSNEEITNYFASKNINLTDFQVGKVVEEFIKNAHTKAIKKNASKEFLEKTSTPNPKNIALRQIGEKKIEKLTNPELTKLLREDYNLNLYDSEITIKKLNTVSYRGDQAKDKVKKVLSSIKDVEKYSFDELLELPKVKKIMEQEGISRQYFKDIKGEMGIVQEVVPQLRLPTSKILEKFSKKDQKIINDFNSELQKITGFDKSSDLGINVTSPLNRFLNSALNQGASNKEIIEQLNKIDKEALANVLVKNRKIKDELVKARLTGIDLDDLNLSHMENVADNWRTSLDANNFFLATKTANQKIQVKLDKDLKKNFEKAKTAKTEKEKQEVLNEFNKIQQELIDNDLVSIIDGQKIGADIDFEKSLQKFATPIEDELFFPTMMRTGPSEKSKGGIISIEEMTRPLDGTR